MSVSAIILGLLAAVNGLYLLRLWSDLRRHRQALADEPGKPAFLAASTASIFFLSTFGISDFALAPIVYRFKKLLADKDLPGTLNTQCVLPVAVMAFAFISVIAVDVYTLAACIMAQVAGAYAGPRLVVKLSGRSIRRFIGVGLITAMLLIVAGKFHWVPTGGTAVELRGSKLAFAVVSMFVFGALNNVGIGSYPLTMLTIYALGMNPVVAFPIMMGACAFSVPIGSMQFIKYGQYSRKITLYASTFGVAGVLVGVFFVKSLDVSMLQWLVAAILLYSGATMLRDEFKAARLPQPATK